LKYVELHSASAFSFLEGASRPEDLVSRGKELEMPAIALVDRDGVYGSPRFHMAAKSVGIRPHVGAELSVEGFGIRAGSLVFEIGSNDGSLLRFFKEQGMKVLGVDPAREIAQFVPRGAPLLVAGNFNDWTERLDKPMRDIGLRRNGPGGNVSFILDDDARPRSW